jgi:branched-chain amino acid transport system permease protein
MAFENYLIHLGILVAIYSILTISLNWAVGFTGLLNLGHVGFFGIGAYVSALLAVNGIPVWISIIIGGIAGLIAGFLLALPTSRLKGDYLALATLGFSFIMGSVARNWTDVTRGALGIPGIPKIVRGNTEFLIIVLIIAVITYFIFWKLSRSQFGKTCEAVRDDELAAKMLGKDTFMTKMLALAVSAFFAGIAGGLFAHYITFIDPSIFGLDDLILLFSMLIVGGLASVKGAAIGTIIIFLIPEPLRFIGFPSSVLGPARAMIYALILLLILIYRPRGIFGRVDLA